MTRSPETVLPTTDKKASAPRCTQRGARISLFDRKGVKKLAFPSGEGGRRRSPARRLTDEVFFRADMNFLYPLLRGATRRGNPSLPHYPSPANLRICRVIYRSFFYFRNSAFFPCGKKAPKKHTKTGRRFLPALRSTLFFIVICRLSPQFPFRQTDRTALAPNRKNKQCRKQVFRLR